MSKIFNIDFRKGTLIDSINNTIGTNTNGIFKQSDKGRAIYLDSTSELDDYGIVSGVKTIAMFVKPTNNSTIIQDNTIDKLEITGGDYDGVGLTQNYINNVDTNVANLNQWQLVISEFSSGIDFSTDLKINPSTNISIAKIVLFDTILSTEERTKLYQDFLRSSQTGYSQRNFYYPKPIDLSIEEDLVAAWNFIPSGGTVQDISGNGNDGALTGNPLGTKEGMRFGDNKPTFLSGTKLPTVLPFQNYTVMGTLKSSANNSTAIFQNVQVDAGDNRLSINYHYGKIAYSDYNTANGIIRFASQTINAIGVQMTFAVVCNDGVYKIYVNGKEEVQIASVATPGSSAGGAKFFVGARYIYGNDFEGEIYDLKVYDMPITEEKVINYHNDYSKQVSLLENFENNGADGVVKHPIGWSLGTGSFKIGESTEKTVHDIGTKYMECTVAGTIGIPSEQAYGTWEFDWYKKIDAANFDINLISDSNSILYPSFSGYLLEFGFKNVKFYRSNSGNKLFEDAASVEKETWYRTKITRTTDGETYIYIKGGSYGDQYVLMTADTGSNPLIENTHSVSNTFLLNISAGDRIANIKITKGVTQ